MDKSDELQELFKGVLTLENRDRRLLALADHLEGCEVVEGEEWRRRDTKKVPDEHSFTMESLQYHCGFPACLVGHGLVLAGQSLAHALPTAAFSDIYGVSQHLVSELYAPSLEYRWGIRSGSPGHITPRHAAAVIRRLVEVGEVDWDFIGQMLNE